MRAGIAGRSEYVCVVLRDVSERKITYGIGYRNLNTV